MDNSSDNTITFDSEGNCNYCTSAITRMTFNYFPNELGQKKLDELLLKIKRDGVNSEYDCLMGLSGGLDSSYLAYLSNNWGLRILAVHIDDGFDTKISSLNLKKIIDATSIKLFIEKPDPKQFYALTKSYIQSGVPNIAIPQDNIVFAYMYKYARKYKIKYFLSGGNFALESILQQGNTYRSGDVRNIRAIHKAFSHEPINKLPLLSDYRKFIDEKILKIKTVRPLNYLDYNRDKALKELSDFCGFEYYGSKHLENTLTKFIQLYWFFNKYRVDKRRSHLSSMIVSGQLDRKEALTELKKPLYDEQEMKQEIKDICRIIGITEEGLYNIINKNPIQHTDFPTDKFYPIFMKYFYSKLR